MFGPEIFLVALFIAGVLGITAIVSKSSTFAEFSVGKNGVSFRVNGQKPSGLPKIDQAKIQDEKLVPPSLEL